MSRKQVALSGVEASQPLGERLWAPSLGHPTGPRCGCTLAAPVPAAFGLSLSDTAVPVLMFLLSGGTAVLGMCKTVLLKLQRELTAGKKRKYSYDLSLYT